MSGPQSIAPILARISQIQNQMGVADDGSPDIQDALSLGGSFASVMAGARAGGVVTSASLPSSWSIPWAEGTKPASPAPAAPQAAARATATPSLASRAVAGTGVESGGSVVWPLRGTITQKFGPTSCTLEPSATVNGHHYAHYHDGLDIGAAQGTPVRSMAAGKVEFAGRYPDGAVVVRVRNTDGSVALYAHLQPSVQVHTGDTVTAGQVVGRVGMTGHTTGPHLHLELTVKGKNIDPLPVLRSGRLPGAAKVGASGWTASSPLAAANGKLTAASLKQFDAVARSIPYHAEIRDAAVRAGVDPLLLASLVKAESGFRPTAVSSAGALGMCQLMPATAKSMGVTDPFDPVQNLRAGARYFAHNLDLYGRTDLALAAYQAGKGAVARSGGVPDSSTTHHYIDRICSYWTHYREAAA